MSENVGFEHVLLASSWLLLASSWLLLGSPGTLRDSFFMYVFVGLAVGHVFSASGLHKRSLGFLLGSSWPPLGSSWAPFCLFLASSWAPLGLLLASSWLLLGSCWVPFGHPKAASELSLALPPASEPSQTFPTPSQSSKIVTANASAAHARKCRFRTCPKNRVSRHVFWKIGNPALDG